MKVGNRVAYKLFAGHTGTIVETVQYGNTQLYVVEWDGLCPLTGRRGRSEVMTGELECINESR